MAILNYTTSINVAKTLSEIQAMLARAGAKSIQIDYAVGTPASIGFIIETQYGERGFKLPANTAAVYEVLKKHNVERRYRNIEQAHRVGWRIIKDWLAAQLALIETEMVTLDEVMLPYMLINPKQTLFELMTKNQLALPTGREHEWKEDNTWHSMRSR